jgi:hypothetical protein
MAHMFLLQYALMYGPVYFGKASFKIVEKLMDETKSGPDGDDTASDVLNIGAFFALYLGLSTALGYVIEEVGGWVLGNPVLVQRFLLLILLVEEIFCQTLFLSAKPLQITFFTLLLLRFVKMVFLRTATHIMLFNKFKSAVLRRSAYIRGLVGGGDDNDTEREKVIKALESTVALFCENELSSFAAILAGVIVVGGVQLEYVRLSAMNTAAGGWIGTVGGDAGAAQEPPSIPFGCDHAFFFLDAQGPTDIPLLIGNVVLMMMASVRRIRVDQGGRTAVISRRLSIRGRWYRVCVYLVVACLSHVPSSWSWSPRLSPSFVSVSVVCLRLSSPSLSSSPSPSPLTFFSGVSLLSGARPIRHLRGLGMAVRSAEEQGHCQPQPGLKRHEHGDDGGDAKGTKRRERNRIDHPILLLHL